MLRVSVWVYWVRSVTFTVTSAETVAPRPVAEMVTGVVPPASGVPEMTPELLMLKPAGKPTAVKESGWPATGRV